MAGVDSVKGGPVSAVGGGPGKGHPGRRWRWWLYAGIGPAVLLGMWVGWGSGLHHDIGPESAARFAGWANGHGPWAPLVYVLGYVLLKLLFVPALPLTLIGVVVFGLVPGALYAWLAANLGATLAFLVARHGARDVVARWARGHRHVARIDRAVRAHGWRILAVTRLLPIFPFTLQNFAYGVTSIRFATYALVTAVCSLPGTAAIALAGSAVADGRGDPWSSLGYLGTAAALLVVLSVVARRFTQGSGAGRALVAACRAGTQVRAATPSAAPPGSDAAALSAGAPAYPSAPGRRV